MFSTNEITRASQSGVSFSPTAPFPTFSGSGCLEHRTSFWCDLLSLLSSPVQIFSLACQPLFFFVTEGSHFTDRPAVLVLFSFSPSALFLTSSFPFHHHRSNGVFFIRTVFLFLDVWTLLTLSSRSLNERPRLPYFKEQFHGRLVTLSFGSSRIFIWLPFLLLLSPLFLFGRFTPS